MADVGVDVDGIGMAGVGVDVDGIGMAVGGIGVAVDGTVVEAGAHPLAKTVSRTNARTDKVDFFM
jgi:hypothetical protein